MGIERHLIPKVQQQVPRALGGEWQTRNPNLVDITDKNLIRVNHKMTGLVALWMRLQPNAHGTFG